jgi:hypothetical protein
MSLIGEFWGPFLAGNLAASIFGVRVQYQQF